MKDDPAPGALPGTSLLAFARAWFPPAIVASVFEPLVADWQREWWSAPRGSRPMVQVRGIAAFLVAAARMSPDIVFAPAGPRSRLPIVLVLVVCGVGVVCQVGLIRMGWREAALPASTWLLLLPGLVTVSLPFATAVGVDAIRSQAAWPLSVQRRTVLKLLAAVTLWMVVGGGWIAPRLGQEWRNAVDSANAGHAVAPLARVSGLSTPELFAIPQPRTDPLIRPGDRQRELESRALLLLLPILLGYARWRVMERPGGPWYFPRSPGMQIVSAVTILILLRLSRTPYGPTAFAAQHFMLWSCLVPIGIMSLIRKLEIPGRVSPC